jgi:acetylornithine deacetylase/succinyl-diaminopimelate desuccinylase-like protein
MPSSAVAYARQHYPRFLDELKSLLRIPSISTLPEHKGDCRRAAETIASELARIGFEHIRLIETQGNPLVYADWLHAAGKPTALFYGHYDVQPTDPENEWLSPPFEPTERDGDLYARGACDDKGQVWAQIKALESLMAATGSLPINVRLLLEGDEEVGGEGIAAYVASRPADLKADFALVSDTELFAPGLPTLCVGLRGMIYTELEVRGARTDLHSGMYGGAAPNPFFALAQMLARLKDEEGHILIPASTTRSCLPARKSWPHGAACPSTRSSTASARSARARWSARPVIPSSNAPGPDPPSMSTASPEASPVRGPRQSFLPRPSPKSPCAWFPA